MSRNLGRAPLAPGRRARLWAEWLGILVRETKLTATGLEAENDSGRSTYPSEEEILSTTPLLEFIDEHVIRPDPFAFTTQGYRAFTLAAARDLDVDPNGIFCIGSGAVGLSMNPGKADGRKLKKFDDGSDIDLAVVSSPKFETAWRDLRLASQAYLGALDKDLKDALGWQKKRLFDGAIIVKEVMPWLSFAREWLPAIGRLNEQIAVAFGREVDLNIWIYRDYWSLRDYVAEGIMNCRRKAPLG